MVPLGERRHRLNCDEIQPVMWAAYDKLLKLLDKEASGTLEEAQSLFRVWYRISRYVRNKPSYPPHETWAELHIFMEYGEDSLDTGYGTEKEGDEGPPMFHVEQEEVE